MPETDSTFLHKKYRDLSASEEVQDVLDFTQPDKPIPPTKPEARIEAYLEFLKGLVDRPDPQERERGLEAIKKSLYARHVIKPEEIPEAYFTAIEQRNRDEGRGDITLPHEVRRELGNTLIDDQKKSLGRWLDHLASDEMRMYPDWLKYFVMRSVLTMGRYDKEKKSFTERTGGTIAPFPDLNHEALEVVLEDLHAKYGEKGKESASGQSKIQFIGRYDIAKESKHKYLQYLEQKNFAKLYALTLEEYKPIPDELLRVTDGQWRTYPRGSDPKPLVDAIAPFGTGWCLRGEGMARQYLQGGAHFNANDLHVYYSNAKDGQPTIPRAVMVVNPQNKIDEVRGIWPGENLDPYIGNIVDEKLNKHPDGRRYKKKSSDMKRLTEIYYKVYPEKDPRRTYKEPQPLTKEDLLFLYQIDAPIEGFGLNDQENPRIAELRQGRNPEEDILVIFECTREQIAHVPSQINENTKAYVGPICETRTNPETKEEEVLPEYVNIFHKLGNLEHVYTSFPEGQIRRENVEIGGKSADEFISEMEVAGINITDPAKSMLKDREFVPGKNPEEATLIRLTVADLGFKSSATIDQVYKRAQILGLELCPADTGPNYRLKYRNQSLDEWIYMGMKQITDSDGSPSVFSVDPSDYGLGLSSCATPDGEWFPRSQFVFRLPAQAGLRPAAAQ